MDDNINIEKSLSIKIEKNIPIPSSVTRKDTGRSKYPFLEMEVNDSFLITVESLNKKQIENARVAILSAARRLKQQGKLEKRLVFISKVLPEGIRVWRVY